MSKRRVNMNLYQDNLKEIEESREGSDIHGLVRRVAHRLYIKNPSNNAENNWLEAQKQLAFWSVHKLDFGMEFPGDLKYYLQNIACCVRSGSCSNDWYSSLNVAACDVEIFHFRWK